MAVNRSRDMHAELQLGITENSTMQLYPNRGGQFEHDHDERLSWPTYRNVGAHPENPAILRHL